MKAAATGPELPNELILLVGENFESVRDLNAFVRTSHKAYDLLNPRLYKLASTTLGTLETSSHGKERLVMHGAEWTSRMSKTCATIFEWLIVYRMYSSFKLILDHGCVDFDTRIKTVFEPPPPAEPDYYPSSPTLLMVAAGWNEDDICRMLLAKGASVNAEDDGKTALHIACSREYGSEDLIRLLIDNGANVEAKDRDGNTPLHVAIPWSSVEVVGILLDYGCANIESRNARGHTPLVQAATTGRFEALKILIEWGADVNEDSGGLGKPIDFFRLHGKFYVHDEEVRDKIFSLLTPTPVWD